MEEKKIKISYAEFLNLIKANEKLEIIKKFFEEGQILTDKDMRLILGVDKKGNCNVSAD